MKYIVDRIEEDFIILQDENGKTLNYKITDGNIKQDIKENDVVFFDSNLGLVVDKKETSKRKYYIENKIKDIFK